jgi:SAM-dependent methyltransferase
MGKIDLWLAYFSNTNPLYGVNNGVSAVAARRRVSGRSRLRILEIGAGGGSGTEALLEVLAEADLVHRIERYLITEPSPFFRRRCQRGLKNRYRDVPLEFGALDVDKPWEGQGAGPEAFDLVYGVNVLHVARDLAFSLAQARAALAPDGWLVAGECLRPFPNQAIYVELVFQILEGFTQVMTNPYYRPNPGFMTPEHWQRSLAKAGFERVEISPDHARIRAIYPRFFVGALCAQ